MFDANRFRVIEEKNNRYENQISRLHKKGYNTRFIDDTVERAVENINNRYESFVIYGDPQSGKTEMMIALTAKLLDSGEDTIIVLVNDNVKLLEQNLRRFRKSELNPTPVNYTEILEEKNLNRKLVIFCKKNKNDLEKLIGKLVELKRVIVIDDEADVASPNSKVNKNLRTKINELVFQILSNNGAYIGVTATPARLDLNNTFKNDTNRWVRFLPHEDYVGMTVFFPLKGAVDKYNLNLLSDDFDSPKHLRNAIFSFLVNASALNIYEKVRCNFSMLIHTSGKKVDHSVDYKVVLSTLEILSDDTNSKWDKYIEMIFYDAEKKFGVSKADEITRFIVENRNRRVVAILNSDKKTDIDPTDPPALYTFAIGGNIVSRGVTFENLLSMFFTRDVKHSLQQDTYIQRARMFGNRRKYLKYFELWIPESLYSDWRRSFAYHYLAIEMIDNEKRAPVWIGDKRIQPVANTSIDRSTVNFDSGEMLFNKFEWISAIKDIINISDTEKRLRTLQMAIGADSLPSYIINLIVDSSESFSDLNMSIRNVSQKSDYHDELYRKRAVLGGTDIKSKHNLVMLRNTYNQCRVVYRFNGDRIRTLKLLRREG